LHFFYPKQAYIRLILTLFKLISVLENALTHQACVLRSDLEKFSRDIASLYSKISKHFGPYLSFWIFYVFFVCINWVFSNGETDRGEKLSATNRSVVNTFQTDLAWKLDILSATLNASIDQQNKHLKSVEDLCQSCVDSHDKVDITNPHTGVPNSVILHWKYLIDVFMLYANYFSLNI
jgi:hypothetical protein